MSLETVHYVNVFLGLGAIALQVVCLIVILLLIFSKENKFLAFIKEQFIPIGFLLSLAPLSVLFHSQVLDYVPCFHCWVQRIFMFPQLFLFGVAWKRNDRNVFWYSLPLLVVGALDAIYLNYTYYFNPSSAPCDASGVSCAQRYVSEFNDYISIPSLSLTLFAALLTLLAVVYFYKKGETR